MAYTYIILAAYAQLTAYLWYRYLQVHCKYEYLSCSYRPIK